MHAPSIDPYVIRFLLSRGYCQRRSAGYLPHLLTVVAFDLFREERPAPRNCRVSEIASCNIPLSSNSPPCRACVQIFKTDRKRTLPRSCVRKRPLPARAERPQSSAARPVQPRLAERVLRIFGVPDASPRSICESIISCSEETANGSALAPTMISLPSVPNPSIRLPIALPSAAVAKKSRGRFPNRRAPSRHSANARRLISSAEFQRETLLIAP